MGYPGLGVATLTEASGDRDFGSHQRDLPAFPSRSDAYLPLRSQGPLHSSPDGTVEVGGDSDSATTGERQ